MNSKTTLTTRFSAERIEQTIDDGLSKCQQIIHLQDQGVREALSKLGWLSPEASATLRSQVEQLQGRCAELESAGAKAAMHWSDAQAGFQSEDLTEFRSVLESSNTKARGLRLQAKAVERSALHFPGRDLTDVRAELHRQAQRLRDQADEADKGGA